MMKPAIFLDRDGVINELVLNSATGGYEPPHSPDDLVFISDVFPVLRLLQDVGFDLFLISNQPDYAKGKVSIEQIRAVHDKFDHALKNNGIRFREYYYCYHHPKGIIPGYSFICECRKPKPFFLFKAARDYQIDLAGSWLIGDRDSDIECGKAAGVRTILIENPFSTRNRGNSQPDFLSENLKEAAELICHY